MKKQRNSSEQTEQERLIVGRLFSVRIPAYIRQCKATRADVSNAKKLGLLGSVNPKVISWLKKEGLL